MNDWVRGLSTSHWTGKMNFITAYNAGVRFWIGKATDAYKDTGKQFEDSRFDEHCQLAFAEPALLKGCYHWLQYSVDPIVAADFYIERYRRYKFDFRPIMDFEERSVIDKKLFSDYAWRGEMFCKRIEEKLGLKPMIYTAKWFTNYFTTKQISWMNTYDLWVADYSWWANNITKKPYYYPSNVWAVDDWDIWQNEADGNGKGHEFGQDALDAELSWYQGDYSQLLTWLNKSTIPEPPEVPLTLQEQIDDLDKRVTVLEGK